MTAYYNEIDPKAAAWLRELIKRGLIADGVVDERSIVDVAPDELQGFTQCHFFAGIGVWSYALRSAGWADDRPVWTGSCPCQPFSAAGRRGGVDDERHLWPHWHHLISQCQPPTIFGEQVASKDGLGWLDLVSTDMEATGYAFGAADLCAAGVGAPHIRQRLFFGATRLADADAAVKGMVGNGSGSMGGRGSRDAWIGHRGSSSDDRLADAADAGLQVGRGGSGQQPGSVKQPQRLLADGGLADADDQGSQGWIGVQERASECASGPSGVAGRTSPLNRVWRNADWLFCRDGKWRPVEPGTFPLAHGSAQRVGRLRGYGNAIVAQVAQTFVESMMDAMT